RDRFRFQLAACQKCVPEGVVGLVDNHAGEAAHEKLALTRMRHGDVRNLLWQAHQEADMRAVGGMTYGGATEPRLLGLPALAIGGRRAAGACRLDEIETAYLRCGSLCNATEGWNKD